MTRRMTEAKSWLMLAGLWVTSVIFIGLIARLTWTLLKLGWSLLP
jgi:hypothetical protein